MIGIYFNDMKRALKVVYNLRYRDNLKYADDLTLLANRLRHIFEIKATSYS